MPVALSLNTPHGRSAKGGEAEFFKLRVYKRMENCKKIG